jgi:GH15 family glucan-1,4-alpha-glucosidase
MKSDYKKIQDYGIIGNLETCALIGIDGSVDWLCMPYLESPAVFCALLDIEKGGSFSIGPAQKFSSFQSYIRHTNVLQTSFVTASGEAVITDFMKAEKKASEDPLRAIFRRVVCTRGEIELAVVFRPRFDYGRLLPAYTRTEKGIRASGKEESLFLASPVDLVADDYGAKGRKRLKQNDTLWFILFYGQPLSLSDKECEAFLTGEIRYWRSWTNRGRNAGFAVEDRWNEYALRSGLVLKLLANRRTGAIAAAPTTSLPEEIGGSRNWDYRYAWLRDSSMTVQALFHMGHEEEARNFRLWMIGIAHNTKGDPGRIKIMYPLYSDADVKESVLKHLQGYKNSAPVRIGNAASGQRQLDIYGELVNAIYETTRYGEEISKETWQVVREIVEYVSSVWQEKDSGIWEARSGPRHYVYSKVMCWVALDRAIKISELKGLEAPLEQWKKTQEIIKQTVLERGFNKKRKAFVQSFDSQSLDATSLLIPLMGFLSPDDPRVHSTIEAVKKELMTKNGLVFRYKEQDGLSGQEGHFVMCSFWLIKALVVSGRINEAKSIFERVLEFISPLGLFSEEIDSETGLLIGNFPQAFSHIGLINCTLYIGIAEGRKHKGPKPVGFR